MNYNYESFVNAVEEAVRDSLPSNRVVQINCVRKNNGKERVGITITQPNVNLSPTFYLEEYYERYLQSVPLEDIVEDILNLYEEVRFEKNWDTTCLTEYEQVKDRIVYKLINTEKNRELLETVPHKEVLDLSLVCYVYLTIDACGTATVPVTTHLMNLWAIEQEELFARAKENTQKLLPVQFGNMVYAVKKIFPETRDQFTDLGMHVLSNDKNSMGAAVLVYDGLLDGIAAFFGEGYYVIPSSIHEVIVYPESTEMKKEDVNEIIRDMNQFCIEQEEILSDHVYYYDKERKALTM